MKVPNDTFLHFNVTTIRNMSYIQKFYSTLIDLLVQGKIECVCNCCSWNINNHRIWIRLQEIIIHTCIHFEYKYANYLCGQIYHSIIIIISISNHRNQCFILFNSFCSKIHTWNNSSHAFINTLE